MRVLFLTSHYPPDVAATGQILEELVEDVVKAGHDARVITAEPSYTREAKRKGLGLVRREWRRGAELVWVRAPAVGRRGVWTRLLPFATYFAGSLPLAMLTRDVDVVFAMSTPPLLGGLLAALVGRLRNKPFVYNLQDIYPDIAINLGVLKERSPLAKAARRLETSLRRRASLVTVLANDMKARVLEVNPELPRVEVIPNWIDTDVVHPVAASDNPFRLQHGLSDKFVVLYSGNLGRAHGLEVLPEVAAALQSEPRVVFLVVGEGPAKPAVEEDVQRRKLDNVRFLPYQPKARLAESLSSGDVSLILQRASALGQVVPSKLYGILASGRPIVASVPEASEVARVVRQHQLGIVVPPESAAGIAEGIRQLLAQPEEARRMGQRGRALVVERFSRLVLTERYIELFEELAVPVEP